MKYAVMESVMTELQAEAAELDGKKRLGKNQKARRAQISERLSNMTQTQPEPTVRRSVPRGPDTATGRLGGDYQGNVYAAHSGKAMSLRAMRRANKVGRGSIQFMRSRIQRGTRRQRTGGVR